MICREVSSHRVPREITSKLGRSTDEGLVQSAGVSGQLAAAIDTYMFGVQDESSADDRRYAY